MPRKNWRAFLSFKDSIGKMKKQATDSQKLCPKSISDKYLHLEYTNNSYNSKIRHITKKIKMSKIFQQAFHPKEKCTYTHPYSIFIYMYACIYTCKYRVCTYALPKHTTRTYLNGQKVNKKRCFKSLAFREMQTTTTIEIIRYTHKNR